MNGARYLTADSDLEIVHDSGSRIGIHLEAGAGVVELNDNRLLRLAIRHFRSHRRARHELTPYLQHLRQIPARVDFTVGGRRIASLNTSAEADLLCRYLGLPCCRISAFGLLLALLRPAPRSHRH
jgi:hypothetical protein